MLYNALNKFIKLLDAYSTSACETKQKPIHGKGMKILMFKQMLKGLPIELAQVKACITSENLLNEMRQIIDSLYRSKEIANNVYNNMMNEFNIVIIQKRI